MTQDDTSDSVGLLLDLDAPLEERARRLAVISPFAQEKAERLLNEFDHLLPEQAEVVRQSVEKHALEDVLKWVRTVMTPREIKRLKNLYAKTEEVLEAASPVVDRAKVAKRRKKARAARKARKKSRKP